MAQEDLLSKLTLALTQKQDQEDTDDNATLFRMCAPQDQIELMDSFTASHLKPSAEMWGDAAITTNWVWGAGTWL
jgi:hypothetical protein